MLPSLGALPAGSATSATGFILFRSAAVIAALLMAATSAKAQTVRACDQVGSIGEGWRMQSSSSPPALGATRLVYAGPAVSNVERSTIDFGKLAHQQYNYNAGLTARTLFQAVNSGSYVFLIDLTGMPQNSICQNISLSVDNVFVFRNFLGPPSSMSPYAIAIDLQPGRHDLLLGMSCSSVNVLPLVVIRLRGPDDNRFRPLRANEACIPN